MTEGHQMQSEREKLTQNLAFIMALEKGMKNKKMMHLATFESEYGKFPFGINSFAKRSFTTRLLRLRGYDPEVFESNPEVRVLSECHKIRNDRVFMIVIFR